LGELSAVYLDRIVNENAILSSERVLHKDYDRRCSIEKKNLVVSLRGLAAKMN
jgi:hypothetical protein